MRDSRDQGCAGELQWNRRAALLLRSRHGEGVTDVNPFQYIERASESMVQHPTLALFVALIGGILSTST